MVAYRPNKESGLETTKQIKDAPKANATMKSKTNPAIILFHPDDRTKSNTSILNSSNAKIATNTVKIGLLVNEQSTASATATGATFSINTSDNLRYTSYGGGHGRVVIFAVSSVNDVKDKRCCFADRAFDLLRPISIVGGCEGRRSRLESMGIDCICAIFQTFKTGPRNSH